MKLKGGYNISLAGRPGDQIVDAQMPEKLHLRLKGQRFSFDELLVGEGQQVTVGDALARDPDNYGIVLTAPMHGVVRLGQGQQNQGQENQGQQSQGHIVLEQLGGDGGNGAGGETEPGHVEVRKDSAGAKRQKLIKLGVWQYISEAFGGGVVDPQAEPQAVIVSTLAMEPFVARGDVQLRDRMLNFTRGLEQLQSMLDYQPIYLVMPDIKSELVEQIRSQIRGYAWVKPIEVAPKYPFGNANIQARGLGLRSADGPVWAIRTEGVLAIDQALTLGRPCVSTVIAVGGPVVDNPVHLRVPYGYPIAEITRTYGSDKPCRVLDGGALTGIPVDGEILGVGSECRGITILPEHTERELFGFIRPGFDRYSYSGCFLSSLRKILRKWINMATHDHAKREFFGLIRPDLNEHSDSDGEAEKIQMKPAILPISPKKVSDHFNLQGAYLEPMNTAVRGEGRPCVACNFCEEVCPAGIMPHMIHKYLYADLIEEADQARVDLCIQCGLCSFVCPSKLDLATEFAGARELIEQERIEAEKQEETVRLAEEERIRTTEQAEQAQAQAAEAAGKTKQSEGSP